MERRKGVTGGGGCGCGGVKGCVGCERWVLVPGGSAHGGGGDVLVCVGGWASVLRGGVFDKGITAFIGYLSMHT